tara:strand:+ start:2962 stop:3297 length:336 start_codon:yes stop_codon:yes gene_type:complete
MPLLNISTSEKIKDKNVFIKKCADFVGDLTKKSTVFVMVQINDSVPMYFSDSDEPCCYLQLKSIGSLDPSSMAPLISEFISNEIGVPQNRIYINFEDVSASNWSCDGKTFG